MSEIIYRVPTMTCGHCVDAIGGELRKVAGVRDVEIDLATKYVVVRGEALDDATLRAAIDEAGYEAVG